MNPIKINDVKAYVRKNIGSFHSSRLQSLRGLKLSQILRRKNPYLFKAKNVLLAQDLVGTLLDAHLSSQEEALFGNFLRRLPYFVEEVYNQKRLHSALGYRSPNDFEESLHIQPDTMQSRQTLLTLPVQP